MATEFMDGDFVAVEDELRVGVVCHGRKQIKVISRGHHGYRLEIEVWLGEVGSNGLPVTNYIPSHSYEER